MQTAPSTLESRPIQFVARQQPPVPAASGTRCSTCHLRDLCLPTGLAAADLDRLDGLRFGRRRVREGQSLFREGDEFQFVYAVRSGTFKSNLMLLDGREQVTGFHMAGELLGFDGLAAGRHASSALALEDAEVCSISVAQLSEVAAAHRGMQQVLARLMSREIVREHGLMAMLGAMNAEERVAAFLLNISRRLKARGYSPREFHLRMSRADIGSYLGMTLETVSRTLSLFDRQGWIEINKKHVRITNFEGLTRAVERTLQ